MGNGEAGGIRRGRGTKLPREVDEKSQEELRPQQQPGIRSRLLHCPALPTEQEGPTHIRCFSPTFLLVSSFHLLHIKVLSGTTQSLSSLPTPPGPALCTLTFSPAARCSQKHHLLDHLSIRQNNTQEKKNKQKNPTVKTQNYPQWGFPCHTSKGKREKWKKVTRMSYRLENSFRGQPKDAHPV